MRLNRRELLRTGASALLASGVWPGALAARDRKEGEKLFQGRIVTVPEASAGLKRVAQDRLKWLDGQLAGKQFLCGNRFTLADILLFGFLEFGNAVGQPVNPENKNVAAWFERVKARPSAKA